MKITKANIWEYWKHDSIIIIPTNGFIKKDGSLVMGRGLALQAKGYIHRIEYILGALVKQKGNIVHYIKGANIISFPVKHNWWEKADLKLIEKSAKELRMILGDYDNYLNPEFGIVIIPKVGCGNGQLSWRDVEPIIEKYLKHKAIIVDLK